MLCRVANTWGRAEPTLCVMSWEYYNQGFAARLPCFVWRKRGKGKGGIKIRDFFYLLGFGPGMFPRTSGVKAWSPVSQFPQVAFRRWVDPKGSHLVHNAPRELELMVFGGMVGTRSGPSCPTWLGWLTLVLSSQPPPSLATMRWATVYHRFLPVGLSHQRPENHPHKRLWNKTISQTKHFTFKDLFWVVIFSPTVTVRCLAQ